MEFFDAVINRHSYRGPGETAVWQRAWFSSYGGTT
jgi:hypothetical protein